jgi:hypothetical protein
MSLRVLTLTPVGNAMGKSMQGVEELAVVDTANVGKQALRDAFDALRRLCPDLTPEQAMAQLLEQRSILFPDPDGDVRLGHGGCIVVLSADGLHAAPEEMEAVIKAGRLLVDERHVVESPDLAPTAEVMKSLERIARPPAEPAFPWRALELAGDVDRPNRKQRRKAKKAARREQRRRR